MPHWETLILEQGLEIRTRNGPLNKLEKKNTKITFDLATKINIVNRDR
jgi:hypothetical protein